MPIRAFTCNSLVPVAHRTIIGDLASESSAKAYFQQERDPSCARNDSDDVACDRPNRLQVLAQQLENNGPYVNLEGGVS